VEYGQYVNITELAAVPSGEYAITKRRIYRATAGVYLFVTEMDESSTSYVDSVAAEDLSEELPSLTWAMPPQYMKGLVGGPNGIMAGFLDYDVYFCEPYRPFAWPVEYSQTVDYPVVGIGVMDTTFAVLTKGVPYFIQGGHPDSMTVVKSDIEQACVSKRSIVSFGGAVVYASPDGLVFLSPGGSRILTETMFTRDQWQSLVPSSMHAYQHDRKYVCFYKTAITSGGFIYDFVSNTFVMHDIYASAGYSDLQNDVLYLAFANRALRKWQSGSPKTYTWMSKKFTMPQIMGFSCAQLEAEGYPVTVKFYADNVLVHTQEVTSREPFRLPATAGRDWDFQIEGNKEVFSLLVAQSMQELANG
jgi:hypothetical protein